MSSLLLLSVDDYIGQRTAYCAYKNYWNTDHAVVTYTKLTASDNSIPGAGMSTTTGKFTAGRSGLYQVVADMLMSDNNGNRLFFRLNNNNLQESHMFSYLAGDYEQEMGGRSMTMMLTKGDTVDLFVSYVGHLFHITFCVTFIK